MEKQIMIKHPYSDRTLKIKNIFSCLKLFVDSLSDKIVINCYLNVNQSKIIDEIMCLKHSGIVDSINSEINKKHYNFNITTSMDNVIGFGYVGGLKKYMQTTGGGSSLGGAIVGGVIAGPIGAIIGSR